MPTDWRRVYDALRTGVVSEVVPRNEPDRSRERRPTDEYSRSELELELRIAWADRDAFAKALNRAEHLAERLEGTEPLTDEELGALGAALHAGVVEGQITEEQHDRLLDWAKLRARLAREDG